MLCSPLPSLTSQVPHTSLIVYCRWQPRIVILFVLEVRKCPDVGNSYAEYSISDAVLHGTHRKGARVEDSDSLAAFHFQMMEENLRATREKTLLQSGSINQILSFVCKKQ